MTEQIVTVENVPAGQWIEVIDRGICGDIHSGRFYKLATDNVVNDQRKAYKRFENFKRALHISTRCVVIGPSLEAIGLEER